MQKALLPLLVALLGVNVAPANAMPFGSLPGAPPNVMPVAMGCSPRWTGKPYGHCHPIGRAYYGYHRYYDPYYHGYTSDLPARDLQWLWNDP